MTEGLSDEMKSFYTELSTLFPETRVTSGKREASGKFSHHHEGNALDIGKEHTDIFEYLNNTPEGLTLMNKYGLGILDETDPRNMEKTHATGPHFHIGKDSGLYSNTKARYEQLENIQPMQSFYSQNPNFDYSNTKNLDDANLNLQGSYNPEASVVLEGPGTDGGVTPFRLVLPNQQVAETFKGELKKEQEKTEIKETKTEESEHRKLLEQKQKEEQEKVEQVISTMNIVKARDEDSLKKTEPSADYSIDPVAQPSLPIQRTLPKLPSIFKV